MFLKSSGLFNLYLLGSGPCPVVGFPADFLIASNLYGIGFLLCQLLNGLRSLCARVVLRLLGTLLQNVNLIGLASAAQLLPLYGHFLFARFHGRCFAFCRTDYIGCGYRAFVIVGSGNGYLVAAQILASGRITYFESCGNSCAVFIVDLYGWLLHFAVVSQQSFGKNHFSDFERGFFFHKIIIGFLCFFECRLIFFVSLTDILKIRFCRFRFLH